MTPDELEQHRRAIYSAVRNANPDVYDRCIQIGHLADPLFTGNDVTKRCAAVEAAVMILAAELLGV